jgi:N-acyl-D-aspartate/D-glutamate deacylase
VTYLNQSFSNSSGNEGKKFIGQKGVTTDASGNATFTFFPATKVAVGQVITAMATIENAGAPPSTRLLRRWHLPREYAP